jgi:hypothetical protein
MRLDWRLLLVMAAVSLLQGCDSPFSIALHDPITPAPGDQVTYSLEMQGGTSPKEVRLYERTATLTLIEINLTFFKFKYLIVTPGTDVLLNTWTSPAIGTLSYTRSAGVPATSLITYRFEIVESDNELRRHEVTYATRDYPLPESPVPAYVTGSSSNTYDIVFIPDTDIGNLNTFRTQCRNDIREAFFDEATTRLFRHSFNFFVNRQTGHATDYDRIAIDGHHQTPSNYSSLGFTEGRVILHQGNLRDYAMGDGLYSSEMQNRGTILHESGHGLFSLADEYAGGSHWQESVLPNNWTSLAGAQAAAPGVGKTASDAVQIGTDGWYKLCVDTCQMLTTGLVHTFYDKPCKSRVIYCIVDIASQ